MSSDFSLQLLAQLIEIPCPQCGYSVQIQMIDAHTQVFRRCPCCMTLIHLIDGGGSVHGAAKGVDEAIDGLSRQLGELFK